MPTFSWSISAEHLQKLKDLHQADYDRYVVAMNRIGNDPDTIDGYLKTLMGGILQQEYKDKKRAKNLAAAAQPDEIELT